jgi:DNA-binding beta-propeller fold protein YncE
MTQPSKLLRFLVLAAGAVVLLISARAAATKSAASRAEDAEDVRQVFYTTSDSTGVADIWAIKLSAGKITTKKIGSTEGGDCISLALSPANGKLYSMCGTLFGTQYLATIDPNTGLANLFGVGVSGLSVMAMTFGPDGKTLYAVGDCNPDPSLECNTAASPSDPNFNSLYKVDTGTGAFTRVGSTGAPQFFMDLALDRDGNMFGVTTTDNPSMTPAVLYRINPATGAATRVTNLVGSNMVMGLAFGRDGRLYGSDFTNNPGLYLIGAHTGFETAIAALPFCCSSGLELINSPDDKD